MDYEHIARLVRDLFSQRGETECGLARTRSTAAVRYVKGGSGFRVYVTAEVPLGVSSPPPPGRHFVGVGVHGNGVTTLRRYADHLRHAGFVVCVGGTNVHRSVSRVWIESVPPRLVCLHAQAEALSGREDGAGALARIVLTAFGRPLYPRERDRAGELIGALEVTAHAAFARQARLVFGLDGVPSESGSPYKGVNFDAR